MSGTERPTSETDGREEERTSGHAGDEQPRWLDEQEKAAWTGLISLVLLLPGKLESPLRQEHGITLFEYLVLSHLSEAPGRRLRMGELAFLASGSLSRLSNVIKRCEQRGWVVRTPDPADGRYTLAELTDAGFDIVDRAAPTHLRTVRGPRPRLPQHGRPEGARPYRGEDADRAGRLRLTAVIARGRSGREGSGHWRSHRRAEPFTSARTSQ
ncbi:MarR family protein [Streptomyces sp. HB202]|nr:MarR family protein [Streptomyces sp. HB202]